MVAGLPGCRYRTFDRDPPLVGTHGLGTEQFALSFGNATMLVPRGASTAQVFAQALGVVEQSIDIRAFAFTDSGST